VLVVSTGDGRRRWKRRKGSRLGDEDAGGRCGGVNWSVEAETSARALTRRPCKTSSWGRAKSVSFVLSLAPFLFRVRLTTYRRCWTKRWVSGNEAEPGMRELGRGSAKGKPGRARKMGQFEFFILQLISLTFFSPSSPLTPPSPRPGYSAPPQLLHRRQALQRRLEPPLGSRLPSRPARTYTGPFSLLRSSLLVHKSASIPLSLTRSLRS